MWLWVREAPEVWIFSSNISATAAASDLKFHIQLGFARAHQKVTPKEKMGVALGAHQYYGFTYNISATATVSDFKFGAQLGFAKAHHKITCRRKGRCGTGLGELPKIL